MLKLFKTLLISLLALIALIAIAVTTAFMVIDPVRYRPALESAFASQTGLQLSMAGDISWTFRPVFGLAVSDLRLRNPGSPMELASLAQLNIKLEPRALLDGRLALQQLQIDGLHVNWLVDEGGRSIWQTEDSASAAATGTQSPATSQPDSAGSAVDTSTIAQISIRNASVSVQDRQRGLNSRFDNVTLSSSNSNLRDRPFPVELAFALTQEDGADQAVVSLSTLARVDLAAGKATLDDLVVKLNPLQLSGAISVENFRDALSLRGSLQSNTFPLSDFLDLYVRSTAEAAPGNALPEEFSTDTDQFSMSVDFAGNAQQMDITALRLSLDQMRVDATATWSAAQPGVPAALRYSLNGNALDITRYTQGAQASPTPGALEEATPADEPAADAIAVAASTPATDTELPIDVLQAMDIEGSHSLESLAIGGLQLSNINAQLSVRNGRLSLNLRPAGFYAGQLTAAMNFDTRQTPPSLTSIVSVQNLDIAQLARSVPAAAFAQGKLNLESFHTLQGRTTGELLASINGSTSFSVTDNAIDIGIVKQLFSSISVLSPAGSGDLAQRWPDVVRFASAEGSLSFTRGIAEGQQFTLQLDNFEIDATGGIDLAQERFDYAALLTVYGEPAPQTIAVAPLYQGVGWPVQCSARFDAQYSQYCGPDFGRVRDLFVEISRNQVQRRVQDAVSDQVPADLQDAARGLLDRVLR
jgi:AsmA protein